MERVRAGSGIVTEVQPEGVWRRDDGMTKEVGASTRSFGQACVMAFLTLLTAVLMVALVVGLGGEVLRGLGVWPPTPGKSGNLWLAILLIAISAMCLAVAVGLGLYAAMLFGGSVRARVSRGVLEVATGVGPIRVRRRLESAEIVSVEASSRVMQAESGSVTVRAIALMRREGKPVLVGVTLSEPRRVWMRGELAGLLGVPDTTESDEDWEVDDEWDDGEDADGIGEADGVEERDARA